jgi:hypothetical protein
MTIGFLFWLLMVLWLVLGTYWRWPGGAPSSAAWGPIGGDLLLFILLFLLGWHAFGFPIKG